MMQAQSAYVPTHQLAKVGVLPMQVMSTQPLD